MQAAVVVFPGSNREMDAVRALESAMGKLPALVWHRDSELPEADLIVVPGGFSYGDYLRCGAIAARAPIMDAVRAHAARGGLVLAICNGFQIACEAGMLPGALLRNASLRFVCDAIRMRVENADTQFTNRYDRGQLITIPIAHGDGRYTADGETLARIEGEGRVVFRYVGGPGDADEWWSPNGSMNAIAGIVNAAGNVLGMMPHPERAVDDLLGSSDGMGVFESILSRVAA